MNQSNLNQWARANSLTNDNLAPGAHTLVLKSGEAAKALGISARKLWDLTDQGKVPHVRIGTSVRYPLDALKKWLDSQVQGARS